MREIINDNIRKIFKDTQKINRMPENKGQFSVRDNKSDKSKEDKAYSL